MPPTMIPVANAFNAKRAFDGVVMERDNRGKEEMKRRQEVEPRNGTQQSLRRALGAERDDQILHAVVYAIE